MNFVFIDSTAASLELTFTTLSYQDLILVAYVTKSASSAFVSL